MGLINVIFQKYVFVNVVLDDVLHIKTFWFFSFLSSRLLLNVVFEELFWKERNDKNVYQRRIAQQNQLGILFGDLLSQ